MAVFQNSDLNATIDEKWDMEIDDARYEGSVIVSRVLNKSALVAKHGDIVNLTYKAKYSVGTVTAATGAFTPQVPSNFLSNVAVSVDQWEQVAIEEVDKSRWQSFYDPDSDFPKDAGLAFGEQYDTQLAGLHTQFTSNDIANSLSPATFSDATAREAMLKLRNRSIPLNDLSWILPPEALYSGIMAQAEFVHADKVGMPKSVLTTNYRFPLLGVPVYETTKLASADQAKVGFLLHRSAMAIAFQKKTDIRRAEGVAAGKLSLIVVVNSLYGLKAFRTDHAARIFVRAS